MGEHKLSAEARVDVLAAYEARWKRPVYSVGRFIPVASKPRLSKRGEVHPSWYTKRLTPSRIKDLFERLPQTDTRDSQRGLNRTTIEDFPVCFRFVQRFPDRFRLDWSHDFFAFVPGGTDDPTHTRAFVDWHARLLRRHARRTARDRRRLLR